MIYTVSDIMDGSIGKYFHQNRCLLFKPSLNQQYDMQFVLFILFLKDNSLTQPFNMPDLNKKDIESQIKEKIEKLEKEIITLKDLTQPISPDSAIGRISRMDAINNKSVNEAALRKKQAKLTALKETLKNIDNPSFGKCIKCGIEIPLGRIMLMPESKKCVRCASR